MLDYCSLRSFYSRMSLLKKYQVLFIHHLPNTSKESDQVTDHKLPNFQNGVSHVYRHTSPTCLLSVVQFSPTNRVPTLFRTRMGLAKGTQGQTSMPDHFVMRTVANVEFPVIFQLPLQAFSWCPSFLCWEAGTLDWAMQSNVTCSSCRITQPYMKSEGK